MSREMIVNEQKTCETKKSRFFLSIFRLIRMNVFKNLLPRQKLNLNPEHSRIAKVVNLDVLSSNSSQSLET